MFLVFPRCFKVVWYIQFKSIDKGSHGSQNPGIMGMLGFGLSHKQIEKVYVQIEAE